MNDVIMRDDRLDASRPCLVGLLGSAVGLIAFFLPVLSSSTPIGALPGIASLLSGTPDVCRLFGASPFEFVAACFKSGLVLPAVLVLFAAVMPLLTAFLSLKGKPLAVLVLAMPLPIALLLPPMLAMVLGGGLNSLVSIGAGPGYWAYWLSTILLEAGAMQSLLKLAKRRREAGQISNGSPIKAYF